MEPGIDFFDIGGYGPIEIPMRLSAVLTFADKTGRQCKVTVAHIVAGFLAMDNEGLIPDPSPGWRSNFKTPVQAGGNPLSFGLAQYSGLERVASDICDCCGAECHAIFVTNKDRFLIERWSIVTTITLLTEHGMLPILPFDWYLSLEREYERICETGRRAYQAGAGGFGHV